MKYFAAFVGLVIVLASLQARAQATPDDQYVSIYSLIEQADALQSAGQPRQALDEYTQAMRQLQQFQKVFPDWNPTIVNYRLNYLSQKINDLTAKVPAAQTVPPVAANQTNAPTTSAETAAASAAANVDSLHAQVQNLQTENDTLRAKLQEALSAQPSAPDAQELAMSQQQVKSLTRENDLLRATANQKKNPAAKDVKQLQMALDETKGKLNAQTARADQLAKDNQRLQSSKNSRELQSLRKENAALEKQLDALKTSGENSGGANAEITKLRAQVSQLQSDLNVQNLEKTMLEKQLRQAQSSPSSEISTPQTNEASAASDMSPAIEKNAAEIPPSATNAKTDSDSELPADARALVAEAQNDFSAHEYDKAEADYQKILQLDPNNEIALANLAAIEMEDNKLPEAQQHIAAALKQSPDDPYDLSIDGYLNFREKKYDDALKALDRAATLDPQNPQIQNYLGVTLSHKGRQTDAEKALLKAVELDPNYAAARNNLAVIYINENPPKVELARWQYQKALDDGQPHNPELEKLLAEKGAPVAEQ